MNRETRLREDRILRNAALELVKADIDHIKQDYSAKSVGSRLATRMSDGAADVYEEAVETAADNRGVLIALIAAVVLWFARNPILALLSNEDGEEGADEEVNDENTEFAVEPVNALQPETENCYDQ